MKELEGRSVIFFDGVCNLCNGFVQYVIRHDKKGIFYFSSLQSPLGERLLGHISAQTPKRLDSIMLYTGGAVYTESTAVLKILSKLGVLSILPRVGLIIPKVIRDGVYKWVARNRYKWFGRRDSCMIPTPEIRTKFIE